MAKFVEAPDLESKVARLITPKLDKVAAAVEREAKDLAPPTKDWVSKDDGNVRPTHVEAHLKQRGIPANLRFKLTSMDWDIEHRGVGPHTWMREPKDETSRAYVNIVHCRCESVEDPEGIRKLISREQPVHTPDKVTIKVVCEGHLVVQAEFGDSYDLGLQADGAQFMRGSAARVAARLRARR